MSRRFVVLKTPWWECIAAGVPYLMNPGDVLTVIEPERYMGPMADRGVFETDVIMNPHRAPMLARVYNEHANHVILYEAENLLYKGGTWGSASQRVRLAAPRCEWWNYSSTNSAIYGDTPAPLWIPTGRRPPARRWRPTDLDVLFVGSMNARRSQVLDRLENSGVRVAVSTGPLFGLDLFALQSRCKIVLNVHYYEPGVFESFRVVPAVATGATVISEESEGGEGFEFATCVPYAALVETVIATLKDESKYVPAGDPTNH